MRVLATGSKAVGDINSAFVNVPLDGETGLILNGLTHPIMVKTRVEFVALANAAGPDIITWTLNLDEDATTIRGGSIFNSGTITVEATGMIFETPPFVLGESGAMDTFQIKVQSDAAGDAAGVTITSVTYVVSEDVDVNTWYVTKSGVDTNIGNTVEDAFVTIGAAISASADGDKIIVLPGTYSEAVDMSTKQVWLEGTNREYCIVTTNAETTHTITMGDRTRLSRMHVINSHDSVSYGVNATDSDNVIIEDCRIEGTYLGVRYRDCFDVTIRDCIVSGTRHALTTNASNNWLVENCLLTTDGSYTGDDADTQAMRASGTGILRNTVIRATRAADTAKSIEGIRISFDGNVLIENCAIYVEGLTNHDGPVRGLGAIAAISGGTQSAYTMLKNCVIQTISGPTSSENVAIYANDSHVVLADGCMLRGTIAAKTTSETDAGTPTDEAEIFLANTFFGDTSKFSGNRINVIERRGRSGNSRYSGPEMNN